MTGNPAGFVGLRPMIPKLPVLPEDHHYAIAAVATQSAQLDHQIPLIVLGYSVPLGDAPRGFAERQPHSERLVRLLQALLHDEFPSEGEEIDAVIAEVKRVRGERNRILHWVWGKSDTPDMAVMAKLPVFGEHRIEEKTATDIQGGRRRSAQRHSKT